MIAVRNRFVAAIGTMHVPTLHAGRNLRRTSRGVRGVDRQCMLVVMVAVGMMEMILMEVVCVAVVLDSRVAAAGSMDVFGMMMRRRVAHESLRLKKFLNK